MKIILKAFGVGSVVVAAAFMTTASANAVAVKPSAGQVGATHAACGASAPADKDGGSWNTTGYGANMRNGSSTGCATNGVAGAGDRLDYHCYTDGNDGFTWTYARNVTDGRSGWVRDNLLGDNGSYVAC
ncbi:SH3 domain-containing protein [Actinosynnema sp. NPDC023587]|uniref:SH3 domain-containing protein n=1 Tax=Actinosynnema sp. NPDC023587 TaxID=3154695 RepID=UPI0033C31C8B